MRMLLVSISALLVLLLFMPRPALAEGCLQNVRAVKFSDGSAKLKGYVCTLGQAKKPQIRVEYYQLSVSAAGHLVHGTSDPDLERTLGTPQLLDNAVSAEAKNLFDQFGEKSEVESCFTIDIATAGQAEPFVHAEGYAGENEAEQCQIRRAIWHLDFEFTTELPLPADTKHALEQTDWPSGYNFFYWENGYCSKTTPIECVTLWRTATPADIEDYDAKYQAYLDSLDVGDEAEEPANASAATDADDASQHDKESCPKLALITYLMRDGWVSDFLLVTGSLGQCGDEPTLDFYLGNRNFALDVAVVTNISSSPVTVDSLLGNALTGGLRTESGCNGGRERRSSG